MPGFSFPGSPKRNSFMVILKLVVQFNKPTVDGIIAAGDKRGLVRAEVECHVRHFDWFCHSSNGLGLRKFFEHFRLLSGVVFFQKTVDKRRMNAGGRNAVTTNPLL